MSVSTFASPLHTPDGSLKSSAWEEVDSKFHSVDSGSGKRCPPAPIKKRRVHVQVEEDPFELKKLFQPQVEQTPLTFEERIQYELDGVTDPDDRVAIMKKIMLRRAVEIFSDMVNREPTTSEAFELWRLIWKRKINF